MKRNIVVFVSLILILVVFVCTTEIVCNLWSLATRRGFFIPKESSVLTFEVLQMNTGSGEWWIYSEDRRNYYFAGESEKTVRYALFPKDKVDDCLNFAPTNYSTWCQEYTVKVE